jgi:hypothetical protein
MGLGLTLWVYERTREREMKTIVCSCARPYKLDHLEDLGTGLDETAVCVQSCYMISLLEVSLRYSSDSLLWASMEGSMNPKSLIHRAGVTSSSANSWFPDENNVSVFLEITGRFPAAIGIPGWLRLRSSLYKFTEYD